MVQQLEVGHARVHVLLRNQVVFERSFHFFHGPFELVQQYP